MASLLTLTTPKSKFESSVFSSSSFKGIPSPKSLTSTLYKLLMSKVTVLSYFIVSLGVNEIGIFKILCSIVYINPLLSFTLSI